MRLTNEFTVAAPLERTWSMLRDMDRLVACVPAARFEPAGGDGGYRGEMQLTLGGSATAYEGIARLDEVDEDGHLTTIDVDGRETNGPGVLSAAIHNRLEPAGDAGTRVFVETDLKMTGRGAQLDQRTLESAADRLIADLAKRLEHEAVNGAPAEEPQAATEPQPEPTAGEPGATRAAGAPPREDRDDSLDLGSVLSASFAKYGPAGAAAVLVLLLVASLTGRRRSSGRRFELRYEW